MEKLRVIFLTRLRRKGKSHHGGGERAPMGHLLARKNYGSVAVHANANKGQSNDDLGVV